MKPKTYYVEFLFRTGQKFTLNPEAVTVMHGINGPVNQLFLDGKAVVKLNRGSPNYDQNNNYYLYNGIPTKELYDLMPDDWDKTQPALKIIDEIYVRTLK